MIQSGKILIVDDEPNLRRSLELLLKRFAYKVQAAVDPIGALEYLQAMDFDLVLLDLKFPVGDGLDLLSRLCNDWPEVRVLILTASDSPMVPMDNRKIKYLQKPVDPSLLLFTIGELLGDLSYSQFQSEPPSYSFKRRAVST